MSEHTHNPLDDALERLAAVREAALAQLGKVIVGQEAILEHLLIALLVRGHVLLEGVPGVAKTLMVKALARVVAARSDRIQFTPDLMPADILGTQVFDLEQQRFHLVRGPIFTELCLADEINRAPARTQAALLQAMEERQVSIDGEHHPLGSLFMVCATQNPIESEGTYPLPEAQLDRFLLKLHVPYPTAAEEDRILERVHGGFDAHDLQSAGVEAALDAARIEAARELVVRVGVEPSLLRYVRQLVHATRASGWLLYGAGPRASINLLVCAKAVAGLRGRGFVTPDDVKFMARPVLRHRVVLQPEVEIDGVTADDVIERLLAEVEVPR